jgi:hypothetical protein
MKFSFQLASFSDRSLDSSARERFRFPNSVSRWMLPSMIQFLSKPDNTKNCFHAPPAIALGSELLGHYTDRFEIRLVATWQLKPNSPMLEKRTRASMMPTNREKWPGFEGV